MEGSGGASGSPSRQGRLLQIHVSKRTRPLATSPPPRSVAGPNAQVFIPIHAYSFPEGPRAERGPTEEGAEIDDGTSPHEARVMDPPGPRIFFDGRDHVC